jgi:hypothetical protein
MKSSKTRIQNTQTSKSTSIKSVGFVNGEYIVELNNGQELLGVTKLEISKSVRGCGVVNLTIILEKFN